MARALETAWRGLLDELARRAPATRAAIRAPGPRNDDDEARLPVPLSVEAHAWFRLHDGCDQGMAGQILPFNTPVNLATAVDVTLRRRALWQSEPYDEQLLRQLTRRSAGQPARTWLDPYLAISVDGTGGGLFVDLRAGARHGCVRWWDKVDADDAGPVLAPGIAALLTEVAHALRTGRPVGGWAVRVVDGALDWEPVEPLDAGPSSLSV